MFRNKSSIAGVVTTMVIIAAMIWSGVVSAQDSSEVNTDGISITVNVNGLGKGEEANLSLSSRTSGVDGEVHIEQPIKGDDTRGLTVQISTNLEDGNYRLYLEAPKKYFRDPKGYSFNVVESEIGNPRGRPLVFNFNLDLPSDPQMGEAIISFSAPLKPPPPNEGNGMRDAGAHYVGPWASQANAGVHGRFTWADTGVDHGGPTEFFAKRAMASGVNGSGWIEMGWAELSWEDDELYVYEYDSVNDEWFLYDLPSPETDLRVVVWVYSGTTWKGAYIVDGWWIYTKSPNLGASTASYGDLQGEMYQTDTVGHILMPTIDNDLGELNVSGWDTWDSTYDAVTEEDTEDPTYDAHYTTDYYDFYIHTH